MIASGTGYWVANFMRLEIYKDKSDGGGFRWRLKSANGRTVADSAEAYAEKRNVQRAIKTLKCAGLKAEVVDLTPEFS